MMEYELVKTLGGKTYVYAYTKQGGYKRKIMLGFIRGNVFWKPHSKIYRQLNSIGMERSLLRLLRKEGVVWVMLRVRKSWYPVPLLYWLNEPDELVEYRGELQHHLKIGRLRVLADAWRDSWERLKG